MTFLEKLFSRTLVRTEKRFSAFDPGILYLVPKARAHITKEYYPAGCEFKMVQYRDKFIGIFKSIYIEYDLTFKTEIICEDVEEVRMDGLCKPTQVIANMLLRKAVKQLKKKYKDSGFRETLASYLYIDEIDIDEYSLEIEDSYRKSSKFRSKRVL